MKKTLLLLTFSSLLLVVTLNLTASNEATYPGPTVYVNDFTGTLTKNDHFKITKLAGSIEKKTGAQIIESAIESPVRQLATNAGLEGSVIVDRLKKEKQNVGYDINKDDYVDMLEAGVIDPAKVTRTALQNAASIASLLLTTEALVTDMPEKDSGAPAGMPAGMPPGMGGMGGMM